MKSSEDPIVGLTSEGVIRDWNPSAERLYGYSTQGAVERCVYDLAPPAQDADGKQILARALTGRVEHAETHAETRDRCKDTTTIDVSVTDLPIRDPDGTVLGSRGSRATSPSASTSSRS